MEIINKVLYWLSTGLLVPTVTVLVFLFIKALLLLGSFYGLYTDRLKLQKSLKPVLQVLEDTPAEYQAHCEVVEDRGAGKVVRKLVKTESAAVQEKLLADYEMACEKDLAQSKVLAKMGPVLGLMGTLIPMGPALVGLASGDIASMSENMQVAFATTVVGLVVGAIGYFTLQVKQRWYNEDFNNLEFVMSLKKEAQVYA
jgi:biopolymer transport protein ExbB/TolQ